MTGESRWVRAAHHGGSDLIDGQVAMKSSEPVHNRSPFVDQLWLALSGRRPSLEYSGNCRNIAGRLVHAAVGTRRLRRTHDYNRARNDAAAGQFDLYGTRGTQPIEEGSPDRLIKLAGGLRAHTRSLGNVRNRPVDRLKRGEGGYPLQRLQPRQWL